MTVLRSRKVVVVSPNEQQHSSLEIEPLTPDNAVENVGQKAAVKVESKEDSSDVDGLGLNGTDVKVSTEVDTGVVVSDTDTDESDKNEPERRWRFRSWFSLEDENKGRVSVVDVEEQMETELGKGKGKGKVIEIDSSSSDSGPDNMDEEYVVGNSSSRSRDTDEELDVGLMDGTIAADAGSLGSATIGTASTSSRMMERFNNAVRKNATRLFPFFSHRHEEEDLDIDTDTDTDEELDVGLMDGTIGRSLGSATIGRASTSSRMRERFKNTARKHATRFAYFSHRQEEEDLDIDDDDDEPEPGPFSTAMKIINDRAANMASQKKRKAESAQLIWVPKKKQRVMRTAPSLKDLCVTIMSQHVDAITSLESVPDVLRHKLTRLICDSRKMNHHWFDLLASGTPTEIRVGDCSWLTEEQFTKTFEKTDASNLTVLQLDQCGRCLPDFVLLPILAHLLSQLSALINISLKGACRLSDAGLKALVASAPALRSINLGCCSLLTVDAIHNLADKLGPVLKELYIDECFDLDAKRILPALLKLEQLEVLSVAHNESVDNSFIIKFVAVRGQKMKELVLANCTKLTDKALRAISKSCPGLCVIDLTKVCKLTDKSLAHLANGCRTIQILKFCRNMFSDVAVAAYLEVCGVRLRELSLNHVNKVAHHTAISLAKHARNLESLDLSFCREMTNEALGLIADSCLSLKTLKLFGCTQITNVFTEGHSNDGVKIIGLVESQILKNIEAVELLPLRYSSA